MQGADGFLWEIYGRQDFQHDSRAHAKAYVEHFSAFRGDGGVHGFGAVAVVVNGVNDTVHNGSSLCVIFGSFEIIEQYMAHFKEKYVAHVIIGKNANQIEVCLWKSTKSSGNCGKMRT